MLSSLMGLLNPAWVFLGNVVSHMAPGVVCVFDRVMAILVATKQSETIAQFHASQTKIWDGGTKT